MDRDKQRGFEFEKFLVERSPLRRFGYRRNPNKYKIDLVSVGLPSVEAKCECCEHAARDKDGKLINMCVQLFTKKWHGEREKNGPWKSIADGGSTAVYVVGEKRDGNWRIVFAGLALQLAQFCDSYLPGGRDHVPENLVFDKSQKITALVPLEQLGSINHGFPWVLKYIHDHKWW
jgi:hypothetical protein